MGSRDSDPGSPHLNCSGVCSLQRNRLCGHGPHLWAPTQSWNFDKFNEMCFSSSNRILTFKGPQMVAFYGSFIVILFIPFGEQKNHAVNNCGACFREMKWSYFENKLFLCL